MTDISDKAIRILGIAGLLAVAFLAQSALATDPPAKVTAGADEFTITCRQDVEDPVGYPSYSCFIKKGGGPKHKALKDKGSPPGEAVDWSIDTSRMIIFDKSFGTSVDKLSGTPKIMACPGWFFIGGKWVYVKC